MDKKCDFSYPYFTRLLKSNERSLVRFRGNVCHGFFMSMNAYRTRDQNTKSIAIVSRRTGNAVKRNRIKRYFREIYRHERSKIYPGTWFILIAKPSIAELGLEKIWLEWLYLAEQLNLFIT